MHQGRHMLPKILKQHQHIHVLIAAALMSLFFCQQLIILADSFGPVLQDSEM